MRSPLYLENVDPNGLEADQFESAENMGANIRIRRGAERTVDGATRIVSACLGATGGILTAEDGTTTFLAWTGGAR